MTFSLTIVSNIAITTLKFVNFWVWYSWYNLFRHLQFVQELFGTLINYINRVVFTFENTSQEFYFCMKVFHTGTNFEKPEQKRVDFFKFKDFIPLYLFSQLIYKIQCSNCNITYYGENEGHLKVRAGEPISTFQWMGKRVDNNKKSSLKDHCLLSGHMCSFEDFTVLNFESHKFKRSIKESLLVTKDKPLNRQLNYWN